MADSQLKTDILNGKALHGITIDQLIAIQPELLKLEYNGPIWSYLSKLQFEQIITEDNASVVMYIYHLVFASTRMNKYFYDPNIHIAIPCDNGHEVVTYGNKSFFRSRDQMVCYDHTNSSFSVMNKRAKSINRLVGKYLIFGYHTAYNIEADRYLIIPHISYSADWLDKEFNDLDNNTTLFDHLLAEGKLFDGRSDEDSDDEDRLAEGTTDETKSAEGTMTDSQLAEGTIGETKSAEGATDESRLAEGTISETKSAEGTMTDNQLAEGTTDEGSQVDEGTSDEDIFCHGDLTNMHKRLLGFAWLRVSWNAHWWQNDDDMNADILLLCKYIDNHGFNLVPLCPISQLTKLVEIPNSPTLIQIVYRQLMCYPAIKVDGCSLYQLDVHLPIYLQCDFSDIHKCKFITRPNN